MLWEKTLEDKPETVIHSTVLIHALDTGNRCQGRGDFGETGIHDGGDDIFGGFVNVRRFVDGDITAAVYHHIKPLHLLVDPALGQPLARLAPAHASPAAVVHRKQRFCHAGFWGQDIARVTHRTGDQDRMPGRLPLGPRKVRMPGGKSACRPLAMHPRFAPIGKRLLLREIVADLLHQFRLLSEDTPKGGPDLLPQA